MPIWARFPIHLSTSKISLECRRFRDRRTNFARNRSSRWKLAKAPAATLRGSRRILPLQQCRQQKKRLEWNSHVAIVTLQRARRRVQREDRKLVFVELHLQIIKQRCSGNHAWPSAGYPAKRIIRALFALQSTSGEGEPADGTGVRLPALARHPARVFVSTYGIWPRAWANCQLSRGLSRA